MLAMPGSLLRRPAGLCRPPGVPVLDPNDPINAGLLRKIIPGASLRDIVGNPGITLNGSPPLAPSLLGLSPRLTGAGTGSTQNYSEPDTGLPKGSVAALTLGAWAAPTGSSNYWPLIYYGTHTGVESLGLYVNAANSKFALFAPGSNGPSGGPTITAGQMYFVVGVLSGTTARLYVNGVFVASATISSINITSGSGALLYFGRSDSSGDGNFGGSLDDGFVYNRPLSAGEVMRLYADPWAGLLFPGDRPMLQVAAAAGVTPVTGWHDGQERWSPRHTPIAVVPY